MATDSPLADQSTTKSSQTLSTPTSASQNSFVYYASHEEGQSAAQQDGPGPPNTTVGATLPYPSMSVYAYGNAMPPSTSPGRPKRTQCKNACTNCQKACKKCDDSRPCQRCVRYGILDTCVDSKRKERKKGVKRGPYKKRDGKSLSAGDAENDDSTQATHGVHPSLPHLPYIGPVGYPPGIWSAYSPTGPGGKLEGAGFFQPVFALTPVGGQPHHGAEGGSVSGGNETPHFPVGFFPTTFISYPGSFQPYPIPQGHNAHSHGFHFAYPPPGIFTAHHLPQVNVAVTNGDQGVSSSSADTHCKNPIDNVVDGSGKVKERSDSQVNAKVIVAELQANKAAEKETN